MVPIWFLTQECQFRFTFHLSPSRSKFQLCLLEIQVSRAMQTLLRTLNGDLVSGDKKIKKNAIYKLLTRFFHPIFVGEFKLSLWPLLRVNKFQGRVPLKPDHMLQLKQSLGKYCDFTPKSENLCFKGNLTDCDSDGFYL